VKTFSLKKPRFFPALFVVSLPVQLHI